MESLIKKKPLTVNQVWMGRRFKTQAYKKYEAEVLAMLPPLEVPDGPLEACYVFGMSNSLSDWDNPVKPFQDVLQKRYDFNDSRIMKATVHKVKVARGDEFITFKIKPYIPTGELMSLGLPEIDNHPTYARIKEEIDALAVKFADIYGKEGLKSEALYDTLTALLAYDKAMVCKAVQAELARRGHPHFMELTRAVTLSNS